MFSPAQSRSVDSNVANKIWTSIPIYRKGGFACACLPADVRPLPKVVVEVAVDELDRNRVPAPGLVSYPVYTKEGAKYCSTTGTWEAAGGRERRRRGREFKQRNDNTENALNLWDTCKSNQTRTAASFLSHAHSSIVVIQTIPEVGYILDSYRRHGESQHHADRPGNLA